jgi:hypothetical protein
MYFTRTIVVATFLSTVFSFNMAAQETPKEPVLEQRAEKTIMGNDRSTLTNTTDLGDGVKVELGAGTRSFESIEQAIARTHAMITQPGGLMNAPVTHGTLNFEINKTFNVNDHLKYMIYAGLEGRTPVSKAADGQGIHNERSISPYAGVRMQYQTQSSGTYDASLQFNGSNLLSTDSNSRFNQPAMATPMLSTISLGLGWISGGRISDNNP